MYDTWLKMQGNFSVFSVLVLADTFAVKFEVQSLNQVVGRFSLQLLHAVAASYVRGHIYWRVFLNKNASGKTCTVPYYQLLATLHMHCLRGEAGC